MQKKDNGPGSVMSYHAGGLIVGTIVGSAAAGWAGNRDAEEMEHRETEMLDR